MSNKNSKFTPVSTLPNMEAERFQLDVALMRKGSGEWYKGIFTQNEPGDHWWGLYDYKTDSYTVISDVTSYIIIRNSGDEAEF